MSTCYDITPAKLNLVGSFRVKIHNLVLQVNSDRERERDGRAMVGRENDGKIEFESEW